MNKVVFDNECREYMEGWNSCNAGKSYFSNPYSCLAYEGELYRLWQKGYNDCQDKWDNGDVPEPGSFDDDKVRNAFTITDPKNHIIL